MKMEVTSSFETSNSPKYKRDKPEDQNLQGASFKVSRAVTLLYSSGLLADAEVSEEQAASIFKAEVCTFRKRLEFCMKCRRLLRLKERRKKSVSSS
jgi:hypothetical protein